MDEAVNVATRLRNSDISTASVILDFKHHSIIKANLQGESAIRDWHTIIDYYRKFYPEIIDGLENND